VVLAVAAAVAAAAELGDDRCCSSCSGGGGGGGDGADDADDPGGVDDEHSSTNSRLDLPLGDRFMPPGRTCCLGLRISGAASSMVDRQSILRCCLRRLDDDMLHLCTQRH
jgi:hypothetical protein